MLAKELLEESIIETDGVCLFLDGVESKLKPSENMRIMQLLKKLELSKAIDQAEGNNWAYILLIIQGTLAMLAASTTTIAIGMYTAQPKYMCL